MKLSLCTMSKNSPAKCDLIGDDILIDSERPDGMVNIPGCKHTGECHYKKVYTLEAVK